MKGIKRLKPDDIKVDMVVEEYMADGTWKEGRIARIAKRKTKDYPNGRVHVILLDGTHDEIGLNEVGKYLRLPNGPTFPRVDLLNASPQVFCETLFLAAKIGVTDAMMNNEKREEYELAELLCVSKHYLYEHVRALYEAYDSGFLFMELRGKKPPWSLTPVGVGRSGTTEHGSYSVRVTQGGS